MHHQQQAVQHVFLCLQAVLTWQNLTKTTSDSPCPHQFILTTAFINVLDILNNHPLIILTNLTRKIIDKAHTNGKNMHPNTVLLKVYGYSSIFSHNNTKYSNIWSMLAANWSNLLKPNYPQTLPI